MLITPGTTLGPYEILSTLGAGGMGEVYRARDTRLGREVALKVLPAAVAQDAERLRRFQTEARSTSELNHPNLLTVFDVGEHDGTSYIVSELLQGETLREHMDGAALSVRRATDYAVQIARGLAAAHERGVVHRDLKPENLFVTTDGRLKILDFGLARQVERVGPEGVDVEAATRKINTGPGVVMGTVGYMSPEQAAGRPADHRADIFSFGAVLYEMLTGRRAFRGETAVETLNAIIKDDPQDFATTAERPIPPALESVVRHCLEKRPERRFQSAGDLAFALEAVSSHSGSTGASVLAPASATAPARAPRRERFIWAGVCTLLALACVALVVAYFSRTSAPTRPVRLTLPPPPRATVPERVTVSPDGRSVVFAAVNAEGKRVLWVRPFDAHEAQPLPATEGAASPFWSPDSRFVGFFANGKLQKIDTTGGRPQSLCDAAEDRGGAWGRDGVILFAGIEGLYRVAAGGGAPVLATRTDEKEEAHRWPYFLPDGRHFIFLGDAPRTEDHHVRLGSLDSEESRILFHAVSRIVYAPPGHLLYVRQGALVAQPFDAAALKLSGEPVAVAEHVAEVGLNHEYDFSASDDGVLAYQSGNPKSRLLWRDRAGAQLEAVGEPADYAAIALSPDARRVAFSLLDADRRYGDLWLYDLARGTNSRLTFDPQGDGDPVWSPDGRSVAFSSNRGNVHTNVYQKLVAGAGEDELLWLSDAEKFPTSWSRDGQLILFDSCEPKARCGVWVQPLAGERRPRPYLQSNAFQQSSGQFSPDGRLVAYASDESGRTEVYVQSFPTPGVKWQVSTAGGSLPQWRADGRELFYLSGDQLMAVDVRATGGAFESGPPRALFQTNVKHGYGGYGYAVAPDGQRFLINTPVEPPGAAPLVIVLNWTSGLRR